MSLKAMVSVDVYNTRYFFNGVSEKGVVLSVGTAGSGVAIDNSFNVAVVAPVASGSKPLGILLDEFVNIDLTRFPINWHKQQAASGDKASICQKGYVTTDKIVASSINAGDFAVLYNNGVLSGVAPDASWNHVANPKVGVFRTNKDSDGFATVYVDL